ncbi:MAG: TetR/AcrR family transcriptional regulator [Eubacterium sp.]|nr:TetR/AcrR family transcriptional regulator [Eubacterium sp.]
MPKVSEEYFENKKKLITDATYNVCLRKPVGMVTMTDVIEETGLSQGGIYRFYKNLDEILSDMITRMRVDYNFVDSMESVMKTENLTFEEVTYKICDILADVMEKHLMDIQKINFDLTVLAINEPERAEAIIKGTKGRGNFEYLASVLMPMLVEACQKNKLKPVAEPEDILKYISATYTGIEMSSILSACYGNGKMNVDCKPKEMFNVLAKTIILLFGGEVK